jgi:hypothetical protein
VFKVFGKLLFKTFFDIMKVFVNSILDATQKALPTGVHVRFSRSKAYDIELSVCSTTEISSIVL